MSCLLFCLYCHSKNKINFGLRKTAAIFPSGSSVPFHNLAAYCCGKLGFACERNAVALFARWRNRYRQTRVSKARRSNGFCQRYTINCELVRMCSFVADGTVWLATASRYLWQQHPFVEVVTSLFAALSTVFHMSISRPGYVVR